MTEAQTSFLSDISFEGLARQAVKTA